jgi:hypothetical protein
LFVSHPFFSRLSLILTEFELRHKFYIKSNLRIILTIGLQSLWWAEFVIARGWDCCDGESLSNKNRSLGFILITKQDPCLSCCNLRTRHQGRRIITGVCLPISPYPCIIFPYYVFNTKIIHVFMVLEKTHLAGKPSSPTLLKSVWQCQNLSL